MFPKECQRKRSYIPCHAHKMSFTPVFSALPSITQVENEISPHFAFHRDWLKIDYIIIANFFFDRNQPGVTGGQLCISRFEGPEPILTLTHILNSILVKKLTSCQ